MRVQILINCGEIEVESLLEVKKKILMRKHDEKILRLFFFIAVYLLHLVDFVESVLIHVNGKDTLYTIYRKMNLLFYFCCVKWFNSYLGQNTSLSFVQFFHCIESNIYWLFFFFFFWFKM